MNTIKTLSAFFFLSACAIGCADGSKTSTSDQPSTTETSKTLPGRKPSTTPVSSDEIISFKDGNKSTTDTSDYEATEIAFRVYGIEAGDGTIAPSATIAEVGLWTTRTYRVGDAIGRGYVVAKIEEGGVTLRGAHSDVKMPIAVDTSLRVIRHEHDVVAQPLGKHRFLLDAIAAKGALENVPARPAAEAVTLYEKPMLKLGDVAPNSLWASADFRKGDLLALVDGKPVDSLDALETALTDGRAKLTVTIYRAGVDLNRSYEADPSR